jgi:4-amino-4-deoxy-L-arabinose transferase-like glycosyltransferase
MTTEAQTRVQNIVTDAPETTNGATEKQPGRWHYAGLGLVMAISGFLHFFRLEQNGYGNEYYSAAVQSMLTSWNNFFYGSLDAGGFITVDKPPLAMWLQVVSARIFGFSGYSLLLPQSLMGVAATGVLYWLVRRASNPTAGLIAGLVLALSPIYIAANRVNNPDTATIFLLVLAAGATLKATDTGKTRWLILMAVLVGLAFNAKMLQGYIALPAFYLAYLLVAPVSWQRRVLQLGGATLVLLAVSLSWAVIADLTPAEQRPYIGGSTNNSALNLALGYNGIGRITGQGQGPGGVGGAGTIPFPPSGNMSGTMPFPPGQGQPGAFPFPPSGNVSGTMPFPSGQGQGQMPFPPGGNISGTMQLPPGIPQPGANGSPTLVIGGNPLGTNEQGIFRLFNQSNGGQIAWLLPLTVFCMLALTFGSKWRGAKWTRQQASLILWGTWLVVHFVVFSYAGGIFHSYYLSQMAPAVGALVGLGVGALWTNWQSRKWHGWLLPVALVTTAALQVYIVLRYPDWAKWLVPVVIVGTVGALVWLLLARFLPKFDRRGLTVGALGVGLAALLVVPGVWSVTPTLAAGGALPMAGPETLGMNNFSPFQMGGNNNGLIRYLRTNQGDTEYLVAVTSAGVASNMILQTGEPVMALGGFLGSDPAATPEKLADYVAKNRVRYFLLGGMPMPGGTSTINDATKWVQANCKTVPTQEWRGGQTQQPPGGMNMLAGGFNETLYDCKK